VQLAAFDVPRRGPRRDFLNRGRLAQPRLELG
jgi:hypothetical protein